MLLFDLIGNGDLVDNQSYNCNERTVFNHRFSGGRKVLDPKRKRTRRPEYKEDEIWTFLRSVSQDINEKLRGKESRHLVLFSEEEYEHNSDDDFFSVSGSSADNFRLTSGNIIGFVKSGPYTLKISSRFGDDFLRYIIADTDGFLEIEEYGGEKPSGGYEWLLAYLWNIKLKRAYRLGMPKSYVSQTEKISRVRGRIDPIDYFQNKSSGMYRCSYREHSYATLAASLFAAAYEAIEHHSFSHPSRSIYNSFAMANEGIRRSHSELLNTPHFTNPFYADYNKLIDLSKRVIAQQGADVGAEEEANTFLFDVSMLFEYFIRKQCKQAGVSLRSKLEVRREIPSGCLGMYRRKLEPDIVFEHSDGLYVFDVKYKYFDSRWGVAREDLFQMHTYLGQYSNAGSVKGCGFIYPMSEKRWNTLGLGETSGVITDVIRQQGKDVPFHVVFLKIPADGSSDFNRVMHDQCGEFITIFKKTVLKEA